MPRNEQNYQEQYFEEILDTYRNEMIDSNTQSSLLTIDNFFLDQKADNLIN